MSRPARLPAHGRGVCRAPVVRHTVAPTVGEVVAVPAPRLFPPTPGKPDATAFALY